MTTPREVDVSFVLPGLVPSGGVRAVFEIADALMANGLSTAIVIPERSVLSPRRSISGVMERMLPIQALPAWQHFAPRKPTDQSWFDLKTPIVVAGPPIWRAFPESRAVVATSYRTAEELLLWPGVAERGVYFIQHYETWSGRARRVDATWGAFDRLVVSSEWLANLAVTRFGKAKPARAIYGVDHATFRPVAENPAAARAPGAMPVVGFMWDDRPWKGGEEIRTALDLLRPRMAVSAKAFGLAVSAPPAGVEFAGRLTGGDLAGFYRSLDVFVSASHVESGPMTVPEAMACGVPVISTDTGNIRLWTNGGKDCRLVPAKDPEALAAAIRELLSSPEELARLGAAGPEAIREFTWERTAAQFESALTSFGLLESSAGGRS